ncbi:MAG: lasso peptide biosynthesis B2 protein [Actinobacteria bacterium]|nr:lasso peptide biosynthesis B2 protein [Actinomycetota bacterium]
MRALRKLAALPADRRLLLLKSLGVVTAARLGVTALPFGQLRRLVGRLERRPSGTRPSEEELAWAVSRVSAYVPRATCLTQALALQAWLARHGYRPDLRIGVTKEDGRLHAHAWVESEGRILIGGSEAKRFAPLGPAPRYADRIDPA